jgi:hypothetical protein
MGEKRNAYRLLVGMESDNLTDEGMVGWIDLGKIVRGCMDWIDLSQDRDQ